MATSSARGASLIVAASIGAVEAFKDQGGLCRWKSYAKGNMGSISQAKRKMSPIDDRVMKEEKAKQEEESLRKVMYLSCWGPY